MKFVLLIDWQNIKVDWITNVQFIFILFLILHIVCLIPHHCLLFIFSLPLSLSLLLSHFPRTIHSAFFVQFSQAHSIKWWKQPSPRDTIFYRLFKLFVSLIFCCLVAWDGRMNFKIYIFLVCLKLLYMTFLLYVLKIETQSK